MTTDRWDYVRRPPGWTTRKRLIVAVVILTVILCLFIWAWLGRSHTETKWKYVNDPAVCAKYPKDPCM